MATYRIITRVDEGGRYWVATDLDGNEDWPTRSYHSAEDCKKRLVSKLTERASEQEVERVEL